MFICIMVRAIFKQKYINESVATKTRVALLEDTAYCISY